MSTETKNSVKFLTDKVINDPSQDKFDHDVLVCKYSA